MFVGAHREAHFVSEDAIIADEAQTAAPLAGAAGVHDHLKALHSDGEFRFDNLDGRGFAIAQMEGGCGNAVFAGSRAGAAAKNLVVNIGAIALRVAPAEDERGAARAAGDPFSGTKGASARSTASAAA